MIHLAIARQRLPRWTVLTVCTGLLTVAAQSALTARGAAADPLPAVADSLASAPYCADGAAGCAPRGLSDDGCSDRWFEVNALAALGLSPTMATLAIVTTWGQANFRQPCRRHDYCYSYGSCSYGRSKSTCDDAFLGDMRALCDGLYVLDPQKPLCYAAASLYYDAVRLAPQAQAAYLGPDGFFNCYDGADGCGSPPSRYNPLVGNFRLRLAERPSRLAPGESVKRSQRPDLLFIGQGWSGTGLNLRAKLSAGDGTWSAQSQVLGDPAVVHEHAPLVGDVDGNGIDDLILIGQNWSGTGLNVRVKLSNGDGTWTARSQVLGDPPAVHTYPALVGDVNGDGRTDLIFVGQNWSGAGLNVRTKLSNGDGTWTSRSQVLGDPADVHTRRTLVGDLNGDGRTDLIFVGQNWDGAGLNVRAKLSNGDGTWTPQNYTFGDDWYVHTFPALVADVSGDGCADLVFVGQNWAGSGLNVRVKFSNCMRTTTEPDGRVPGRTVTRGPWTSGAQVIGDGAGVHTYPTLVGDVNGDGRADLVFVGQNWSGAGLNVRVKLSNGDGTWTSVHNVLGDGPGVHLLPTVAGDVNGDGRLDLIFTGIDYAGPGLYVRTKLSNANGTWTAVPTQTLGDGPYVRGR